MPERRFGLGVSLRFGRAYASAALETVRLVGSMNPFAAEQFSVRHLDRTEVGAGDGPAGPGLPPWPGGPGPMLPGPGDPPGGFGPLDPGPFFPPGDEGGGHGGDKCDGEEFHCQYDDKGDPDFCEHRMQARNDKGECVWVNECLPASVCCEDGDAPITKSPDNPAAW